MMSGPTNVADIGVPSLLHSSASTGFGFEKRGVTIKLVRAVRDYIKAVKIPESIEFSQFLCIPHDLGGVGVAYRRSMDFDDRVSDDKYVRTSATVDAVEVVKGNWLKCQVPGQDAPLFLPMKSKDTNTIFFKPFIDSIWSVDRVCALIVGNHEILDAPCRWGDYMHSNSALTYSDRCSLIDWLKLKHFKHHGSQLGVCYELMMMFANLGLQTGQS